MNDLHHEGVPILEELMANGNQVCYRKTLPEGAVVSGNGNGAWSNESAAVVLDNGQLTKEILDRLKELRQIEAEEPQRGVYVILPPNFEHLRDEIEPRLLDAGVHIICTDTIKASYDAKDLVVLGAGFPAMCMPLLTRWNENDVKDLEPITGDLYASGPTATKRGGNNKPWYDLELKRRRAKIAKQSKRRNRK